MRRGTSRAPLLVWQLTNRGFGSEVLLLLLAQLYALTKGYEFVLASKCSNLCWRNGWSDYFKPSYSEINNAFTCDVSIFESNNIWVAAKRVAATIILGLTHHRKILLSCHVWREIWTPKFVEGVFNLPEHGISGDAYAAIKVLMQAAWRLNDTTRELVEGRIKAMGLRRQEYFGFHIRRGDKTREAPEESISSYFEKAHEIAPRLKTCFVASDDYATIQQIEVEYPDWHVISMVTPSRTGHDQATFNLQDAELRRSSTLELLTEIEALRAASFFVGTFSSNVGVLLALLRGLESSFGVDGPLRIYRPY